MIRSLRLRLTLWYALALGVGLMIFATAVWTAAWRSLHNDVEQSLEQQVVNITTFLHEELLHPNVQLPEELSEYAQALPGTLYMNVESSSGTQTFSSTPQFPWRLESIGDRASHVVNWRHEDFLMLSRTIQVGGTVWRVSFAHSLARMQEILRRLRWLLIALTPAVMAVASLGGVWLSRKALRPVHEITEAAREIGLEDLSRRLQVPQTGDELQRLSETWNGMLARLEDAVSRLTRFTADAAHELRTPVAVIRSTAEIAGRRSRSEDAYREAFASIALESDRMTALMDDLLFLARSDSNRIALPMADFDPNDVLAEVSASMLPIAEAAGLTLTCEPAEEHIAVQGNRSAIRRLVLILVDNAIKYSRAGGAVRVTTELLTGELHLRVSDQGFGIAFTELPFVFDRFYRGANARQGGNNGAGLGLALASGIAKLHQSKLVVAHTSPDGSIFELTLTARRIPAEVVGQSPSAGDVPIGEFTAR